MRERATSPDNQPAGHDAVGASPSSHALSAAGSLAVNRIGQLDAAALVAGLHGSAEQVGAFLDHAAALGELKDAVAHLSGSQSTNVLQHALQTLQGQPLTPQRKEMLQAVFDGTPDGYDITLMLCFQLRFGLHHVGLKRNEGSVWDTRGLRRTWNVMKALPPAQVENRPELASFTRSPKEQGGEYDPETNKVIVEAVGQDETLYTETNADGKFNPSNKDPLDGSNMWDSQVRHEIGHAVEKRLQASTGYCTTAAGGSWRLYTSPEQVLKALYESVSLTVPADVVVTQAENPYASASEQQKDNEAEAAAARTNARAAKVDKSIELEVWASLLELANHGRAARAESLVKQHAAELAKHNLTAGVHHVLTLLKAGVKQDSHDGPSAWDLEDGGPMRVGGRTFFKDEDSWASYATEARARKVSLYQFRSPFEWFAECYSAYYDPREGAHGGLLAERDPATKEWFDRNVDSLKQTPQAATPQKRS